MGWHTVAYAEIEPFPCAHLAHHYPEVPNLGDVTKITEERIASLGRLDVLTFGSPCQDFSVAGDRAGLAGGRSGLFIDAMRIARWARKHCGLRFAILENVVGILSCNGGRDFARVVTEMAGLDELPVPPRGWGTEGAAVGEQGMVEWAVLDAQWFGVAQRRRRLFALLDFGDWAHRPPILLEPEGLRGDSAPRRQAGEGVAGTLTRRAGNSSRQAGANGNIVGVGPEVARCVATREGSSLDYETTTMIAQPICFDPRQITNPENRSNPKPGDPCHTIPICSANEAPTIVEAIGFYPTNRQPEFGNHHQLSPTLKEDAAGVAVNMRARRLTPRECERLQGMPDDYTLIPFKGKPAADGPRYRALGNSAATTVMKWIGEKIELALWWEKHL